MRLWRRSDKAWLSLVMAVSLLGPLLPGRCQGSPPAPPRPALYGFGSGMCLYCREMEKILKNVQARYGDQLEVRLVHINEDQDLTGRYQIILIPTQVFLDASGEEVYRHLGLFPQEELVKKLQELKFIKKK